MNLFSKDTEIIPATIPEDPAESYTTTFTTFYVSKGKGELQELTCSNYKKVLRSQMEDKPEIASKVGSKGYKFPQLKEIIGDYNQ